MEGNYAHAAWLVLIGMVFDSMDGRVARFTRSTSNFGIEYDSLSDLVTFALAPALLVYLWALEPFGRLGWLLAFLYTVCGALRLARFNVMVGAVPKGFFQGLPSPVAAGTVATAILFYSEMQLHFPRHLLILPVLLVTATLMISNIRFASFKEFRMNKDNSFGVLAVIVLIMTLIAIKPEVSIFVMSVLYIPITLLFEGARGVWGHFRKIQPHSVATVEGKREV